jgi:hypothetical protein
MGVNRILRALGGNHVQPYLCYPWQAPQITFGKVWPGWGGFHDRMPLSLDAEQVARWMNPEEDVKALLQELRGQSAELHLRPVDPRVNNARNKEGVVFL